MTWNITQARSLHLALRADAAASGATGVLLLGAGRLLSEPLGAPAGLLQSAGVALVAFAGVVLWVGLRPVPARAAVWAIVAVNGLWTVASAAVAFASWIPLTGLGRFFVLAQAAAVVALTLWQVTGVRKG